MPDTLAIVETHLATKARPSAIAGIVSPGIAAAYDSAVCGLAAWLTATDSDGRLKHSPKELDWHGIGRLEHPNLRAFRRAQEAAAAAGKTGRSRP